MRAAEQTHLGHNTAYEPCPTGVLEIAHRTGGPVCMSGVVPAPSADLWPETASGRYSPWPRMAT